MMKATLLILFLSVLQVTVNAWVATIPHDSKIPLKHGGHCYTDSYNLGALKNGEKKRVQGQCAIASCMTNKDISVSGCGVARIAPPCFIGEGDLSKPYPDCCFEVICPESEINSNSF